MCYSLSDDKETYEEIYTKFWDNFLTAVDLPDDIWRKAVDYMHSKETEEFIDMLNELIEEAIVHGGDTGGPYFSNPEGLEEIMKKILEALGLSDVYEIDLDDEYGPEYLNFKKKEKTE